MQATASFHRPQLSSAVLRMFIVAALLSAFVLGGTGGYLVRGLSSSPATTTTTRTFGSCPAGSHAVVDYVSYTARSWTCVEGAVAPQPSVTEPVPYSGPTGASCDRESCLAASPAPEPTRDPSGNVVPI
jgi:hypothetical protein